MSGPVLRFHDARYISGPQLAALSVTNDSTHEDTLRMREALGRHFGMAELQSLPFTDLCDLYVWLVAMGGVE